MRRIMAAAVTAALALGVPAGAETEWQPTAGGWVSGSVEYLGTILHELGTGSDATLHDGYLYVTTWRSFSIYDVRDLSDPAGLEPVSTVHLGPSAYNESPQTNGEILLVSRDLRWGPPVNNEPSGGVLEIYDVKDKRSPKRIGRYVTAAGVWDHLWTCVLDCTYAYSAYGTILDLRDPTSPKVADSTWRWDIGPLHEHHFISEIAPGIVLTGSRPMYLLDARTNPERPPRLATITPPSTKPGHPLRAEAVPARTAWPNAVSGSTPEEPAVSGDPFAVVSMETPFTGSCTDQSGKVLVFDTTTLEGTGTFELAGEYQITENGTFTDGKPPVNVVGCGAYGLSTHPAWGDEAGRLAAVAFFEHGVRLLEVGDDGTPTEVGGFLPHLGNSAAVRWLSDDVLAVVDLHRGIDLLRIGD